MNIKDLELSEEDFKMIMDALEALPERANMSDFIGEIMIGTLAHGDKDMESRLRAEKERRSKYRQSSSKVELEDIRVLQGKLIMMKRILHEEGALKQANDILSKTKS